MRKLSFLFFLAITGPCGAEQACFRSADEAAMQTGVRDGLGFRLESISLDTLAGTRWASVRSCPHPERPGLLVRVTGAATSRVVSGARTAAAKAQTLLVRAGGAVRVVTTDAVSRVEMEGIAQAGAAAGESIRVRLTGLNEQGPARFVDAVVRAEGLVEVEATR